MPELRFRSPLWIAVYIAVIQYVTALVFVPILMCFLPWASNLCILLFVLGILGAVARETRIEGLVLFSDRGLRGCALGQFGKSNHVLYWDEIYRVEPYRYFGLHFLLVRYHSAELPLWLPCFLANQTKLNLLILEYTSENNPLHTALLERNLFNQVPWHSLVRKYKSDRYILESAYVSKIPTSFLNYCKFCSIVMGLPLFLLVVLTKKNIFESFVWLDLGVVSAFCGFSVLIFWFLFQKDNYIALKYEGIKAHSHLGDSFIPWLAIKEIKIRGIGIFQDLQIWLHEPVGQRKFIVIPLYFIDRRTLKKSMLQTESENPLYQAAIRYL